MKSRLKFVMQIIDITDPDARIEGARFQSIAEYNAPDGLTDEQRIEWAREMTESTLHSMTRAAHIIVADYRADLIDAPQLPDAK